MKKTGNKVLKKIKGGAWIAVALMGSLIFAPLAEGVAVPDNQILAVISVSDWSSEFEGKKEALDNQQVIDELELALSKISLVWKENSVEAIKKEINRQEAAGLDVYIIQWGDTLSAIAAAIEVDEETLAQANNLEEKDLILVGDILTFAELREGHSTAQASSYENQEKVTPPSPPTQPIEPTLPVQPEQPIKPEQPVITEQIIQEHQVLEPVIEVVAEEAIPAEAGRIDEEISLGEETLINSETSVEEEVIPGEPIVTQVPTPRPVLDDEGNPIVDEIGQPVMETVIVEEIIPGIDTLLVTTSTTQTVQYGFDTRIIYDNTLAVGTEVVEQAGQNGLVAYTTVEATHDGLLIDSRTSEMTLQEAIERIVRVGTKEAPGTLQTVVETITTLHGTIQVTDPSLYEDDSEVTLVGTDGLHRTTYEVILDNQGNEMSRTQVSSEIIEAIYEVITVGSKAINETKTETRDEDIAFNTQTRENPALAKGERNVLQVGQDGLKKLTYTVAYQYGEEVSRVLISEVIKLEAVPEIIEVGTKIEAEPVVETVLRTETAEITFTSQSHENSELLQGESRVLQVGQNGLDEITYQDTLVDGVVTETFEVSREILLAPVIEIIEIGTKVEQPTTPTEEVIRVEEIEFIAFETIEQDNPDLAVGERNVLTTGIPGQATVTYDVTRRDGIEVSRMEISRVVIQEAVNEVVEVGTRNSANEETITQTTTYDIPFETEELQNINLLVGQSNIVQQGVVGRETITEAVTYVNGQAVSRVETSRDITTEPVTQIVEVGTKKAPVADTDTSNFHQVSYTIVSADLPSEQIVIDLSTLTSDELYDMSEHYAHIVDNRGTVYAVMDKENFRDATTYISSYLYYGGDSRVEVITPANVTPALLEFFDASELINNLAYDIQFKADHMFNQEYTQDLVEVNELFQVYTPAMLADVKANKIRAERLLAALEVGTPEYESAEVALATLNEQYYSFVTRYDNALTDGALLEVGYSQEASQSAQTEAIKTTIEQALEAIPSSLKLLIQSVTIVPQTDMPNSWNGTSTIAAFATGRFELFFSQDSIANLGLVYHELGHLIDFSTVLYNDTLSQSTQLSDSDEWQAIFAKEWDEAGSYYATQIEAFGQAYGAYALNKYHNLSMEDVGYVGYGLENRPDSTSYFDMLFTRLGY